MSTDAPTDEMPDFLREIASEAEVLSKVEIDPDKIQRVHQVGLQLAVLEDRIKKGQDLLAKLEKERRELRETILPNLLDDAGTDRVGIPEHKCDLVVKEVVKAVLPSEDKHPEEHAAAVAWLDEHGHGDIVNTVIMLTIPRQDRKEVPEIVESLKRMTNNRFPIHTKTGVAWATLTSWAKERLRKGETLPLDLLGIFMGRVAELKKRS